MEIKRIFVEKKEGFDIPAKRILGDITGVLKLAATDLRLFLRYDIAGIDDADFAHAVTNVFSEPPCDSVYEEILPDLTGYAVFGVEYLPGQYDQRADSAEQCVELLLHKSRPRVKTATVYAVKGVDANGLAAIQKYLINPTDSRLCGMIKPLTLEFKASAPASVIYLDGFCDFSQKELQDFHTERGFAMSLADLTFVQSYFKTEHRAPSETELKVIDTYWSDHCRHTTFLTELKNIDFSDNDEVKEGYALYNRLFQEIYKGRADKYLCLMDIATIGAKALKREGFLKDLDESDEINACSIKIKACVNGKTEDWLVMFKNETHNHPTEIEPFGGAATCLGGAIRDPLSGRVYVYQSMRITGAGDIFADIKDTLPGKLPQRVISKTAAAGFSSYGNQIGLATGIVHEIYHPGYVAKRLETGFVVGAAPATNVVRAKPASGDVVILLGGETGRDGCGGATGSSKAHNQESVNTCGAEVQKGNPLTERKLQRFFRNADATRLIKKCNDFGAGGVSVAIGELSDGLDIDLDKIPKKYAGLSVTELAISESQERMAVVVAAKDVPRFLSLVRVENLDATPVATVTDFGKLRMFSGGKAVVDIKRSFLDTNGVKQTADVQCRSFVKNRLFEVYSERVKEAIARSDFQTATEEILKDKNVMLQKGLGEMFDSTIGAATVLMPFGGTHQLTPSINMAAKLPVISGDTSTATIASWGFCPSLTDANPYVGGVYAVLCSVVKLVAGGADPTKIRLTLQEFFKRLDGNPERFGEPFAALLGALYAQYALKTPAIGGKDSMSGSFEKLDVPNTLVSFALSTIDADCVLTNVFQAGDKLYRLPLSTSLLPDFSYVNKALDAFCRAAAQGLVKRATVVETGGAVAAAVKSCLGNKLGLKLNGLNKSLYEARLGDIVFAAEDITCYDGFDGLIVEPLGETNESGLITAQGLSLTIDKALELLSGFTCVYPTEKAVSGKVTTLSSQAKFIPLAKKAHIAKPRVLIPVFPGTNCEVDTARRFEAEGAIPEIFVIQNGNSNEIAESVRAIASKVRESQILAFPGGFSGGDEPDGSGKFIAATFRNPFIAEAVEEMLYTRDGLALGICNGFQALIKLGLLPYGKIIALGESSPTLTFNRINRHVSTISRIRIATTASPWLSSFQVGDVFAVPVSHGEGRFVANESELADILKNNQIATQYVDLLGNATMVSPHNPNGSLYAVEGLISPDGRILGKMGHSERYAKNLYKNIGEPFDMNLFASGIKYYN
ncbi:MAG: phosphoribosylformylglycinamidine synthase [Clostridia bacterium]|nr:phosphoribosylformylglycinamidine synthase [Clostridia bacterium]